jgi:SM-20-related protein
MTIRSPMSALDFERLRQVPLTTEPFSFVIVPGFIRGDALAAIHRDYPRVSRAGSFPVSTLRYGPAFAAVVEELQGPAMRRAIEEKFGIALDGRPTMVTVRGRCRARDGAIHTDSLTKIITVLIYMNGGWEAPGGRLRLLRSASDLEDFIAEVPPVEGTLLAFKRSDNSYHGHKPFEGERRAIQLNWVTHESVVRKELSRHRLSAWVKTLNPFA